ncbi:GTPase Era, mitochondrial [Nerophis ophidion]|uniref:GTPase Era, mitochondrial n=1 Tax=Nerophis ophidion TaxID=159077 RepID=UPI002AE069D8|nr:GTPase Era, mitochondrial [Nerophis ophidion]
MALRVCWRSCRDWTVLSRRLVVFSRQERASSRLKGNGTFNCGRSDPFSFTPACFITSDAFVSTLLKGNPEVGDYRLPVSVPLDNGEQTSLLQRRPDQPINSKILKVAIIGSPNAGKSTLSNQLLGRKVFAVSKKVHTTRKRSMGVLTEHDTQIILLDTPGLTTRSKVKRHQLEKSLLLDPWSTVTEADLMVVVVDVSDKWMCKSLDFQVLKCLAQNPDIPAVLVLNKVDKVKMKDRLLAITGELTCGVVNGRQLRVRPLIKPPGAEKRLKQDSVAFKDDDPSKLEDADDGDNTVLDKDRLKTLRNQKGWGGFKDVFMLSSLDKEDVETLKSYLMVAAKGGSWQYHSKVLTDQSPVELCTDTIREKLLEHLPQEVPYLITQDVELWEEDENGLNVSVKILTQKESHFRMAIGTGGQVIARIAQESSEQLTHIFLKEVKLRLSVKMKK